MANVSTPSPSHLVLIPSYNPGPLGVKTMQEARHFWNPVWVVIDGSNDGSTQIIQSIAKEDPGIRIIALADNGGKGHALRHGMAIARREGFTHALTMDADGQHPADQIPEFMATSIRHPGHLILGRPIFDESAPTIRVKGRRISNFWANLETLWCGIDDSLFGFRVYPIQPLLEIMPTRFFMQRFDFDPEAAVRLAWRGIPIINREARVRYLNSEEGGISHFRYGRDNTLLTSMHLRLMLEFLCFRWPHMAWIKWRDKRSKKRPQTPLR